MQQAALFKFPKMQCTYRFKNRSPEMTYTKESIDLFRKAVAGMPGFSYLVS